MANFSKEWEAIRRNTGEIARLANSNKKIDRLAAYLLSGKPVTGRTLIEKFGIYSYRDTIYDLGKKGYDIQRKVVTSANGVEHKVWWLAEFSEEWAKMTAPEMFK